MLNLGGSVWNIPFNFENVVTSTFASLLSQDFKISTNKKHPEPHMLQSEVITMSSVCEHTREDYPKPQAKQQQYVKKYFQLHNNSSYLSQAEG